MSSHDPRPQSGPDAAAVSRLCDLGLPVIALCGPACDGAKHGRAGHPPNMSGKLPVSAGWQRSGYRPAAEVLREWRPGCNVGVLCGLQPAAPGAREPVGVAVVDGDGPEALAWMRANLPPTPVRDTTRRGEHWYYRARGPVRNRNLRHCTPRLELEVLGNGRQVVVPPSVHASGHAYAEVERWTPELLATMPDYDPAWFAGFAAGGPATAGGGPGAADPAPPQAGGGPVVGGGSWPGERAFTRAEYARSFERALAYLQSPRCPPSVSGRDGHGALYSAAVKVLRGFPLASWERMRDMRGDESLPVDAEDAAHEAFRLLQNAYNPRCLAEDGQTPYPWSPAELWHKVESAAAADRLPGPDYWLFDAKPGGRAARDHGHQGGEGAADPAPASRPEWSIEDVMALVAGSASGAAAGAEEGHPDPGPPENDDHPRQAPAALQDSPPAAGPQDSPSAALPSIFPAASPTAPPPAAPGDSLRSRYQAAALALVGPGAFEGLGDDGEPADPRDVLPDPTPPPEPVEIEVTHHVHAMTNLACQALARHPNIFSFKEKLCVKARDHDPVLPPRLYVAKRGNLIEYLSDPNYAVWYHDEADREGEAVRVFDRPDPTVVRCAHERPIWRGVKGVKAVVSAPVLTPDGRILQRPGYDEATGLLYEPPPGRGPEPPFRAVSRRPSRRECLEALGVLADVVKDFPFDDRRKTFGAWLSAVLTRFCRYAYTGNTPLFAVTATMASSGKGKLRDAAAIIADGVQSSVTSFDSTSEGEVERKIGMEIMNGERHVCIDNVPEGVKLASATLDAMLTSPKFSTRKIGTSEKIHASFADSIAWATGNNMQWGGDLWRRLIEMPIADRTGHPELRETDRPNLEDWCRAHRRDLVHAALTLVSGYCAAGSPKLDLQPMASFEGWSLVRRVVVWCGLTDPFESRGRSEDDEDVAVRATLFSLLRTASGDAPFMVSQLWGEIDGEAGKKKYPKLHALLREAHVKGSEDSLGRYLAAKHRNKSVRVQTGEVWTLQWGRSGSARTYRVVVEAPETGKRAEKGTKRGQK